MDVNFDGFRVNSVSKFKEIIEILNDIYDDNALQWHGKLPDLQQALIDLGANLNIIACSYSEDGTIKDLSDQLDEVPEILPEVE